MKRMTRRSFLQAAAVIAAAGLLPACSSGSGKGSSASGEEGASFAEGAAPYSNLDAVTLIGADSSGKGAACQLFGEMLSSRVSEITGGKLTIDYYPDGELGDDAQLLQKLKSGSVGLVVCQMAPMVSLVPETAVFDLPMAFSRYSGEAIDRVLNSEDSLFREELSRAYEAAGLKYLGILQNATYRVTTANRALSTLQDFAGLKIRTMENSNHMAFWSALGAEPVPLPFSELYTALQKGTVDAEENAVDTIEGSGFDEVQGYLCCTNHILYANQICMNRERFDSLDPAYQAALTQAVSEVLSGLTSQLTEIDTASRAELEESGMTVVEYEEDFFEKVLALDGVKALYDSIDAQAGGIGTLLNESLDQAGRV